MTAMTGKVPQAAVGQVWTPDSGCEVQALCAAPHTPARQREGPGVLGDPPRLLAAEELEALTLCGPCASWPAVVTNLQGLADV